MHHGQVQLYGWYSRGLVLSAVLEECGLLKRIAYYVILKCGGTYKGTVFGCFIIGIILNLITFCNGWLVASVLVYGVCKAMGLKTSNESALICFAGDAGQQAVRYVCIIRDIFQLWKVQSK